MTSKLIGLLAAAALFAMPGPLAAATVQVTYTGTVSSGTDQTGEFGAGADLTGNIYTAVYVIDTTRGIASTGITSNQVYGGTDYGVDSPILSAVLTINGNSVVFSGDSAGTASAYNDGSISNQSHSAQYLNIYSTGFVQSTLANSIFSPTAALPASLETPFSYSVAPGDSSNGNFYLFKYDNALGQYVIGVDGVLTPLTLTVSQLNAVPVPGALPLFASGLVGLGLLGWRRRRSLGRRDASNDAASGRVRHLAA